jgi:CelD/BcsL family acetyltransferase involved in cellulose biosynthesis
VLNANLIVELDALEPLCEEWDALAESSALPLMAPGWALAWWRHLAPKHSLLRAVEIRDGTELVGLAPFYVAPSGHGRRVYRLLGSGLGAPLAPLALPGREQDVAKATSKALSQADPRPDLIEFEGNPLGARWHTAMRDYWPGRARPVSAAYRTQPCPTVWLNGASLEAWLAGRSRRFRSSMRRLRRRFDEEGGTWRISTKATLRSDIETFQRLHAARWDGRGESTLVAHAAGVGAMLNDAGCTLIGGERFRLWVMEIDGEAIGADIYLACGGIVLSFNGGWDERWKRLSPPLLATIHTIEDCSNRGEQQLDLGPGGGSHKTRFANGERSVAWSVLMMPGRRLARTVTLTAPALARGAARGHAERVLKPAHVYILRKLRHRARRLAASCSTAQKQEISDAAAANDMWLRSHWRFTAAAAALTAAAARARHGGQA